MKWSSLTVLLGFAQLQLPYCEGDAVDDGPQVLADGRECAVGSAWRAGCRECSCVDPGYAECRSACNTTEGGEAEYRCKPDSRWQDECNKCFCTSDGVPSCTRMLCRGITHTSLVFPTEDGVASPSEEKEKFQTDDLKTEDEEVLAGSNRVRRQACTPSSDFQRECNVCKCDAEGASYTCTRNECMDTNGDVEVFMEHEGRDHIESESVCRSRATFPMNCNTCVCNAEGTDYHCTDNVCPLPDDVELFKEIKEVKHDIQLRKCDPHVTFRDGCRECRCDEDGKDYTCNDTECNRNSRSVEGVPAGKRAGEANRTTVCEAGKAFRKECNTCWCNDDGTSYFCTRKVCVPDLDSESTEPEELGVVERECRPREVFELECNTCRCDERGASFLCTRRVCVVDAPPDAVDYAKSYKTHSDPVIARLKRQTTNGDTPKPPVKTCEPGVKFRQDCNTCLCHTDGLAFSCTRYECNAPSPPQPPATPPTRRRREVKTETRTCVAGSVFEQGCNVCRCADDGERVVCTDNKCAPTPTNATASEEPENAFRCTPGEQFKRACNDCTCSADGKSVFCTLKLCEKEVLPAL